MSRDMMPSFELYQPDSLEGALKLAKDLDKEGWLVAGGQDSYDWFKDRAKRPAALVDLSGIAALRGIRDKDGGLEIGPFDAREPIARTISGSLATVEPQARQQGEQQRTSEHLPASRWPPCQHRTPMDAPFTLEPAPGGAILTVDEARLTLDQEALRELRDGIDAAVARGAA